MIKVMIVDDQQIFREGLKMMLQLDDAIEVVGLCSNGDEAVKMVSVYKPDIVLMDIQMPVMNGVEAVKHMSVPVIMLTTFHNEDYILDAIKAGALGYLLKDSEIQLIVDAIKTVHHGGALMDGQAMKVVLNQFTSFDRGGDLSALTERETEISKLVAEGFNNKEISDALFLGEGTIKNHLTRILQKLGLRDRTQLAIYMLKGKK